MANVTIYEHFELPDENGDLMWPADIETTIATSSTHTLRAETKYVVVCADTDCRIGFNGAAVASGKTILSAIENPIKLIPGKVRTLQFV